MDEIQIPKLLQALEFALDPAFDRGLTTSSCLGFAYREVLHPAETKPADLIVMGARGKGGMSDPHNSVPRRTTPAMVR